MKRILVTGGAGFIGSHLCERLLDEGNKVICLDNYVTGRRKNVKHLIDNRYFELIRHDITRPITMEVDQIYNLASPASFTFEKYDPINTLKTNFIGMMNILEIARSNKIRVLQASTSEVYGDPLVHPQIEDYWGNVNPIGVRSSYDEGKRVAESLCMDYKRCYDVDVRIVRIFNTFGPRILEKDGRVVSTFIVQALKEDDITIFGDGLQTRSFCYVDDLVDGIIRMMNNEKNFSEPINLGSTAEHTINELARLIKKLTVSKSKIVYKISRKDDPKRRKPDISKAKKLLGWEPKIELKKGLLMTIEYFRTELNKDK
ncbi:UDP-glucuronic acid decarboxylase family protein [Wukongibacter sp. M2B1]|uniref:UDP-glucuronic acid decarboxylase family protein n=1 Tax=Wukongibacter sp. M2B1 TaxID=3088895 RepID=UPI003D79EDC8